MSGLFDDEPEASSLAEAPPDAPLAERLRPTKPEDFYGQRHLVGDGRILAGALAGDLRQAFPSDRYEWKTDTDRL
jgi:replication-associated recombination protein RarA